MNTKENFWFNIENYKNIFREKSNKFEFKPHDSRSAAWPSKYIEQAMIQPS